MKKIVLYEHAGSYNHGCEAIIRSTCELFSEDEIKLVSHNKNEDIQYGLDKICKVEQISNTYSIKNPIYLASRVFAKFFGIEYFYKKLLNRDFFKGISSDSLYFSTGGDNYCYQSKLKSCKFFNREINKRHGKTVLWGVSIEPDIIAQEAVKKDLKKYALIVARESITRDALLENGLTNVTYCPDPAFCLPKSSDVKPVFSNDIVGINISPMALDYSANRDVLRRAYINMIKDILHRTPYSVYLVPHVIWNGGDDRVALKSLYDEIEEKDRVFMVPDADCETLKSYISHCRFFVGARTHATIAAYSQGIPTLVVGYSVKARGIAKDLFGTSENYVKSVQDIDNDEVLKNSFLWLEANEASIRDTLKNRLSVYPEYYAAVKEKIKNIV